MFRGEKKEILFSTRTRLIVVSSLACSLIFIVILWCCPSISLKQEHNVQCSKSKKDKDKKVWGERNSHNVVSKSHQRVSETLCKHWASLELSRTNEHLDLWAQRKKLTYVDTTFLKIFIVTKKQKIKTKKLLNSQC